MNQAEWSRATIECEKEATATSAAQYNEVKVMGDEIYNPELAGYTRIHKRTPLVCPLCNAKVVTVQQVAAFGRRSGKGMQQNPQQRFQDALVVFLSCICEDDCCFTLAYNFENGQSMLEVLKPDDAFD